MEKFKRSIQPVINIYHLVCAIIANIYYGFPSKRLKVVGITGTDGKTTTTHLIYHILKTAGKKASMVSSVYAKVGDKEFETGLHVTMPDSFLLQKLMRKAVDNGDEYFVLETTSHGLDQNRNWGIRYDVGVITNITKEHLDYHKTYENYVKAKVRLLKQSRKRIINIDDDSYLHITHEVKNSDFQTYGLKKKADFSNNFKEFLKVPIADFNNYNYLAAYAVSKNLGITDTEVYSALKSFTLPLGRLETVYDKDFKVVIDFAHTPNSLQNVLAELKKHAKGRLIHVFGSAGLRDAVKRPSMGEASGAYASVSIVTEEDYRTEDPLKIANDIAKGLEKQNMQRLEKSELTKKSDKVYVVIIDREQAIQEAIRIAQKGEVVVCTGKSHEKSLNRNGKEYPWSEYDAVKKALALKVTS